MWVYNRKTDTLTLHEKPISPILVEKEEDFTYYNITIYKLNKEPFNYDELYELRHASKYINTYILEEMTNENDYEIFVEGILLNPEEEFRMDGNPFVPRYNWKVYVYKIREGLIIEINNP